MKNELFINGKDAYEEWHISLTDGGLSTLMTPAANKEYIKSKSRLEHGARTLVDNARLEERELSLPFHITAKTKDEFLSLYNAFCNDVLRIGRLAIYTRYQANISTVSGEEVITPTVVYRLDYISCSQFEQYHLGLGKFTLRVVETNPYDRAWDGAEQTYIVPYFELTEDMHLVSNYTTIPMTIQDDGHLIIES